MAEVAEVVNDVQPVEKETVEKKAIVEVDEGKTEKKEKDTNPKENGRAETNEKEAETNGSAETKEATATKRKSGAGDAPDGTPAEGAMPEKKAKISNEDKEKDSTNGESEVASEGATATPNTMCTLNDLNDVTSRPTNGTSDSSEGTTTICSCHP